MQAHVYVLLWAKFNFQQAPVERKAFALFFSARQYYHAWAKP